MRVFTPKAKVFYIFLIVAGVATGYFLTNKHFLPQTGLLTNGTSNPGSSPVVAGKIFGSEDETTFKDSAEGILKTGGIDGEGAYHLERAGGPSQNVYLTSSVMDLSQFAGRKVKVWGQTNQAQKAGWLMDVGRLQILE